SILLLKLKILCGALVLIEVSFFLSAGRINPNNEIFSSREQDTHRRKTRTCSRDTCSHEKPRSSSGSKTRSTPRQSSTRGPPGAPLQRQDGCFYSPYRVCRRRDHSLQERMATCYIVDCRRRYCKRGQRFTSALCRWQG